MGVRCAVKITGVIIYKLLDIKIPHSLDENKFHNAFRFRANDTFSLDLTYMHGKKLPLL